MASTSLGELSRKLKEEGHSVSSRDLSEFDIIFGDNCCRMVPELVDHYGVTVKEVQKGKYGRSAKKTGVVSRGKGAGG